jgi:hypothetical protein
LTQISRRKKLLHTDSLIYKENAMKQEQAQREAKTSQKKLKLPSLVDEYLEMPRKHSCTAEWKYDSEQAWPLPGR